MLVRALELDFSNGYQGYKALFGPRFRVCKDCFDSLSDRRSDERCEGAGETACELLYSQSRGILHVSSCTARVVLV